MKSSRIPPKKILVPFDFSRLSTNAWGFARELAGRLGASVEAVFVYEAPLYTEGMGSMPMSEPLNDDLQSSLLRDIRRELGEEARVTVLQGYARDQILELARRRGSDLIVMGTHGRTGAGRVLFGSVAESLSRHSEIPVLTLRGAWRPVKRILVPLNFAAHSLLAFDAAASLSTALGARFDALFVADGPYAEELLEETFAELMRRLPPYFGGKTPRLLRASGSAVERIVEEGKDRDLVVMTAHRKSMFRDVILGTTVERVLRHCETPVLAIPAESRKGRPKSEVRAGVEPAVNGPARPSP